MGSACSRTRKKIHLTEDPQQSQSMSLQPLLETVTIPSQVEHTSTTAGADLEKFTLFPKLPPELRIKIWKLLLPNGPENDGKRIFRLRIAVDLSGKAKFGVGLRRTSMYTYRDDVPVQKAMEIRMEHEYKEDMRKLALLRTCHESRAIFFEKSKSWNTLPAIHGGNIYFEDSTTIYIEGLMAFLLPINRFLEQLNTSFETLPRELNSIQHVVIGWDQQIPEALVDFLKGYEFKTFGIDVEGESRILHAERSRIELERSLSKTMRLVRRSLEQHKTSSLRPYIVPQFGLFRWVWPEGTAIIDDR